MKNVSIEAWRFIFAIYMMIYHIAYHIYGIKTGGYIAVDVFFIISGYFMAFSQMEKGTTPFQYVKSRFVRLYPMYIIAYFVTELIRTLKYSSGLDVVATRVYESFPEMFMLDIKTSVNGPSWYVAAIIIAGFILYAVMCLDKNDVVKTLVFPVLSLFIYSQFHDVIGQVHAHNSQKIFPPIYDGLLRAFAGMALGAFAFVLVKSLKSKITSKKQALVLAVTGNTLMAAMSIVSLFKYHGFVDFWYIFLIFAAVICINLGTDAKKKSEMSGFAKTAVYLGGLSYPIYLLHDGMYNLFRTFKLIKEPALGCIVIILIVIAESALITFILKKVTELLRKRKAAKAEKPAQ